MFVRLSHVPGGACDGGRVVERHPSMQIVVRWKKNFDETPAMTYTSRTSPKFNLTSLLQGAIFFAVTHGVFALSRNKMSEVITVHYSTHLAGDLEPWRRRESYRPPDSEGIFPHTRHHYLDNFMVERHASLHRDGLPCLWTKRFRLSG